MSVPLSNTFKVSQLAEIQNIDHEDLLMVSDYDNGNCYTRKMNLSALYDSIANDSIISNAVLYSSKAIGKAISQKISSEMIEYLASHISSMVLSTISVNYQTVQDMLDGTMDNSLIIDLTDRGNV